MFRRPTIGEVENFEGAANNERARASASRNLAKAIVVAVSLDGKHTVQKDPSDAPGKVAVREAWEQCRAKHGGAIHIRAMAKIQQLTGQTEEETGKD